MKSLIKSTRILKTLRKTIRIARYKIRKRYIIYNKLRTIRNRDI